MKTFNTERGYSKEGQIINYEVLSITEDSNFANMLDYLINFEDTTRGITGKVSVLMFEGSTEDRDIERAIMQAYDGNNYI